MIQSGTDFFGSISTLIRAKLMREAPEEWDHVLSNSAHVPVVYTRSMVTYQSAYIKEKVEKFSDLSMVLYHENKPAGVWPLTMRFSEGAWSCGSNEGQLIAPLFAENTAEKTRKALMERCLSVIETLCRLTDQEVFSCVEYVGESGVDGWHRKIMERGAAIRRVAHEIFVDLSMSIEDIRANLRKSYKSLLSTGGRLWQSSVFDKIDHKVFDEFRQLHHRVSGRVTRSLETWDLVEKAINDGAAFLVVLRDDKGVMVGGGLFYISKTEGLYAVGVYDRTLFDKPLGHIVQMKALEHMKTLGLRWHKLGERFYQGDSSTPTEKELSIAHFKEGFATHMFLRLHTEVRI
jgi:FemAB family protein